MYQPVWEQFITKSLTPYQRGLLSGLDHACSARYTLERLLSQDGANFFHVAIFKQDNGNNYYLPITTHTLAATNTIITRRIIDCETEQLNDEAYSIVSVHDSRDQAILHQDGI
jgi:hypothetical protein